MYSPIMVENNNKDKELEKKTQITQIEIYIIHL